MLIIKGVHKITTDVQCFCKCNSIIRDIFMLDICNFNAHLEKCLFGLECQIL